MQHKRLPALAFRSVVRLGSTTVPEDNNKRIELNTAQSIKNSASKLLMKECFTEAGVKTAKWCLAAEKESWESLSLPIVTKSLYGSRGIGNTKLDTLEQLESWSIGKNLNNYILEEFIKMTREYRLHITQEGCFYTCRKLLKNDAPEGTWQRHDDVCNWIVEENPKFKKPNNWELIVQDCIKAQKALSLDICAFDVMTQGSKDGKERDAPEWIICESCSAPSFGSITLERYIEQIPKTLINKYNSL